MSQSPPSHVLVYGPPLLVAALAARDERAVHDVPIDVLQDRLRLRGQILTPDQMRPAD